MTDLLEDVDVDVGGVLEDKGGQKHLQGGERNQGWGERQVLVFATKSSPLHSFSHTSTELADGGEDPVGRPPWYNSIPVYILRCYDNYK